MFSKSVVNSALHVKETLVHAVAPQQIILQNLVRPDTKLGSTQGFNAITHRYYNIKRIELSLVSFAICGS